MVKNLPLSAMNLANIVATSINNSHVQELLGCMEATEAISAASILLGCNVKMEDLEAIPDCATARNITITKFNTLTGRLSIRYEQLQNRSWDSSKDAYVNKDITPRWQQGQYTWEQYQEMLNGTYSFA